MSRILITGGTGFIGANFVHKFVLSKDEVHVFKREDSDLWRIENIKKDIFLHDVDLADSVCIEKIVSEIKPEHILHFASYGTRQGKEQDTKKTIDTNLLGTINILNACAKVGFSSFINTGSSSEYGEKNSPMKETDILEPNNLYGVTKAASTLYCQQLAKKKNLPVVTMRLFSVFGYMESSDRLIPALVKAVLSGEELKVVSPSIVRDFIFIEDVIDAYLKAISIIDTIKGNVFNIASGRELSIADIVEISRKVSGKSVKAVYGAVSEKQIEPKMWVGNIEKAKKILHWSSSHTFEEGFSKLLAHGNRKPE